MRVKLAAWMIEPWDSNYSQVCFGTVGLANVTTMTNQQIISMNKKCGLSKIRDKNMMMIKTKKPNVCGQINVVALRIRRNFGDDILVTKILRYEQFMWSEDELGV